MAEKATCGIGYHTPETGMAYFICALPEGHEGPHEDKKGNKSVVVEKSHLAEIDREIKQRLREGASEK